jgi:MinD-like ATPase involved in chromosome partitioning or flagellar assembly
MLPFTPLTLRRRGSRGTRSVSTGGLCAPGLSFTNTPGPLLAVVGLCGGAGASTLAYLTAATAAMQSDLPVLVCDTGGPTAGLAAYAGVRSPLTLADASERIASHQPVDGSLFAVDRHGLRVIAGEPQFTVQGEPAGIQRILEDARDAHVLSVLDCGTLSRAADQTAMSLATHIAWVLPASENAVARASRVLARIAALSRPEILIVRATPGKAPLDALTDLADQRRAPLLLMPTVRDVLEQPVCEVADEAAITLQAIGGLLRR